MEGDYEINITVRCTHCQKVLMNEPFDRDEYYNADHVAEDHACPEGRDGLVRQYQKLRESADKATDQLNDLAGDFLSLKRHWATRPFEKGSLEERGAFWAFSFFAEGDGTREDIERWLEETT